MAKGTIQNKDAFLARLSKRLQRPKPENVNKPASSYAPQMNVLQHQTKDELIDVFIRQCDAIHTTVFQTTRENLAETLELTIAECGGKRIVAANEQPFADFGLTTLLEEQLPEKGCHVHIWNPDLGDENISVAERADVGITFSDITLAESGTVVLFSHKYKGRAISLLPTSYIALIPKSTIVPRMTQAATEIHRRVEKGETIPACINFISGPSNSADIEMNLVVGVHGPIRATYIIIKDC